MRRSTPLAISVLNSALLWFLLRSLSCCAPYDAGVTRGDDSDGAAGTFFEGAMVRGYVSAETEAAVQASIVAAGYGH